MKHQAAYSLLWLSGKENITEKDVQDFMKQCGVSCDNAELKIFFKSLGEQSITDLVKAGDKRKISMPCGGGGGGAAAPAGGAKAAVVEDKKEEKEEDVDMGDLFGDDGY